MKQLHIPFGGAVDADEIPVIPDKDGKYWAFYVNGEYASAGVDATDITEGATYAFKVE